jgi:hypothetical protein
MNTTITYIFILLLVLILLAYYAGLTTDANAVFKGLNSFAQTITGRNSQNQFAAYPTSAPNIG